MAIPEVSFFNRELSWLEFNQRVLDEALDVSVPLLDRLSFLAITASNLDEFFMVRVGGLKMLVDEGMRKRDPSGMTPRQQLDTVMARALTMVEDQYRCYREDLEPLLAEQGIRRVHVDDVTPDQRQHLRRMFDEEIFPVVSPMAADDPDDFPYLVNLRLHVMVRMKASASETRPRPRYAVIPLGDTMTRFVTVPTPSGFAYVTIEDVIRLFIHEIFPGREVLEVVPFRVTRNADMSVREDQAEDFLSQMQEVLDKRRRGDCVRVEVKGLASKMLFNHLRRALQVRDGHAYRVPGPMALAGFEALVSLGGFEALRSEPWQPLPCPDIDAGKSIFDELKQKDVLLYHPYDSFDPVLQLVQEAASDPDVLAIKQTLYRVSRDSPVVDALKKAAERGKVVTVIVELKARFDEARNIEWARELEKTGAQVIYGIRGLKTHAKACLVVRREPQGVVRYLHFGTGNYNERTARLYSDVSLLTSDTDLGTDTAAFFNAVTGYSEPQKFLKLAAAPLGLREQLMELIEGETERCRQGQKAFIRAKMNSLVCPKIIKALYAASQAGVTVDLNIRGICCLRPGIKGLSDNISVISIVDRFLEHSRVFHFHHGGEEAVFISSADWMPRNLDRRVELLVPVENPGCRRKLMSILDVHLADTVKARVLRSNGGYRKRRPGRGEPVRSQEALRLDALAAVEKARTNRNRVFEIHRPSAAD